MGTQQCLQKDRRTKGTYDINWGCGAEGARARVKTDRGERRSADSQPSLHISMLPIISDQTVLLSVQLYLCAASHFCMKYNEWDEIYPFTFEITF